MDGRVKTLHPAVHGGLLGGARQPRASGGDAGPRHRARSISWWSISTPSRRPLRAGQALRRLRREHRHRRPGDDPRGGEEPRATSRSSSTPPTMRRFSQELDDNEGSVTSHTAPPPRPEGLCAHGRLRRGDLELARRRDRRGHAALSARSAARSPKSCATARTRTRPPPSIAPPKSATGVATARQVQGKQLSYNNINDTDAAYEAVAEFAPSRSAAVVIVKHANPCGVGEAQSLARGLREGAALRPGLRLRRHRRVEPPARCGRGEEDRRDLHRGDHRAGRERGGASPSSARRRTCASSSPAACPIRARAGSPCAPSPAASSPSRATTRSSTTWTSRS